MPPITTESRQGHKSWPSYFLVRPTGEIVPLIAADELPPGINLVNIPRKLELEATKGMLNLGLQKGSGGYYQMGGVPSQARSAENTSPPKQSATRNSASVPTPGPTSISEDEADDTEVEDLSTRQLSTRAPTQTRHLNPSKTALPPSYTNPQNITDLCRHWCMHGICKWGQQCRYKHIMPMTLHGLQEVGLRDWPAWYRGLNPGYFVDSREGSGPGLMRGLVFSAGKERGVARAPRREGLERKVGGTGKGEELGDQILRVLKGMNKERVKVREREREINLKGKMEHEQKEKEKKLAITKGNAIAAERATLKSVLRWEDDESEVEEMQKLEEKKKNVEDAGDAGDMGRKLVDI